MTTSLRRPPKRAIWRFYVFGTTASALISGSLLAAFGVNHETRIVGWLAVVFGVVALVGVSAGKLRTLEVGLAALFILMVFHSVFTILSWVVAGSVIVNPGISWFIWGIPALWASTHISYRDGD